MCYMNYDYVQHRFIMLMDFVFVKVNFLPFVFILEDA